MSILQDFTNLQPFLKILKKQVQYWFPEASLKSTQSLQEHARACKTVQILKTHFAQLINAFPIYRKSFSELLKPDAIFQKFKVEK